MKGKKILIATIFLFVYINSYNLFSKLIGFLAIPLFLLTGLTFLIISSLVLYQVFLIIKEKFQNKKRVVQTTICLTLLSIIILHPLGIIPNSLFEGKDLFIAKREGAANCMSTF